MKIIKNILSICAFGYLLTGCTVPTELVSENQQLRATGDMGVVIERATGQVRIVNHSRNEILAEIDGLGDLSHASIVYSRDQRFAYVFGRDGGLTKIDILKDKIANRIIQSGNSIGAAFPESLRSVETGSDRGPADGQLKHPWHGAFDIANGGVQLRHVGREFLP